MPRTGRPKTDSPKQRSLSLRVDDAEYEKLKRSEERRVGKEC